MDLGSYDHTHDYPERDRQGSKPVGPAGKRQTRRIANPTRQCGACKMRGNAGISRRTNGGQRHVAD